MRSLITVITGITGIAVGSRCCVICMEGGIAAGAGRLRIVGARMTPMIIQVATNFIGVDSCLCCFILSSGYLAACFIVSIIKTAAGTESNGPDAHILH